MGELSKSCASGWPCLTFGHNLLLLFFLGYVFCSFVFYRYQRLMVKRYRRKGVKTVATKGQAAREGWLVRETERMMDVELFLEGQTKWEEDSPHQLVMLYEMFKHAADKRAEGGRANCTPRPFNS